MARKKCQTLGGNLLNHYDKTIEKMIYETKGQKIKRVFWTGLNDLKKEGDFYWLNGTQKVTNVPWKNYGPDGYEYRDCALLMETKSLQVTFIHQHCDFSFQYICEVIPAFMAFVLMAVMRDIKEKDARINVISQLLEQTVQKLAVKRVGGQNTTCNNVNGYCIFGCVDGYQGDRCEDPSLLVQIYKEKQTEEMNEVNGWKSRPVLLLETWLPYLR
ncbi:hypothetical protein RRG08_002028 [Elysia crispata]|uniref:C-type lectin domain-containing protein n=1 Tax=Elysia crispata TaxID=231223 RepID=A0AAE1B3I6_9GAST|nr:hypothetical protein RRG08_002028 [Elysia crispata]